MAPPRVLLSALGLTILCATACPSADAQSFLDIADSVRDRVVPRPSPQSVPEFILIAELANKNKHTSPRPPGSVPDFVLIGESVHSGGGVHRPGPVEVPSTSAVFEVKIPPSTPLPPVSGSTIPDAIHLSDFTRPSHGAEGVTQPVPAAEENATTVSSISPEQEENGKGENEKEENGKDEDFDEDKIYFEEWEKELVDPR